MSYERAKYIYPKDIFYGGYVDNMPNTLLDNKFSPYALNMRLDGGAVVIRPGHTTLVEPDGTDYPRGMGSYLRSNPTLDRLVIRQNADATHDLVSITSAGVATNISTGSDITVDDRMRFTNIGDSLYCMNGTDFGKLDGISYANILTSSNLPSAPQYSVYFAGCHWAGGTTSTSWSNKVYKSPANNPNDFTASGSDIFTFPENITGMAVAGQAIFVFTKNTIHTCTLGDQVETAGVISFSFKPIQTTEGALNHDCIVSVGSDLFYITPSNKINRIVRGSNVYGFEVVELSDRKYTGISTILNSLSSTQDTAFGQYYPQANLIKWFFKSYDSTINDVCIIYDTEKDYFFRDTNKYFYDGAYFANKNFTASHLTNTVFEDEVGFDDDDSAISFEYWTKAFDEGENTIKKEYWESRADIDINENASLTQEIYLDSQIDYNGTSIGRLIDTKTIDSDNITQSLLGNGIGTLPVATFPVGLESLDVVDYYPVSLIRQKGNLQKRGNSIQFRYTCNSLGARVRLKRLGYKMEILSPATVNITA